MQLDSRSRDIQDTCESSPIFTTPPPEDRERERSRYGWVQTTVLVPGISRKHCQYAAKLMSRLGVTVRGECGGGEMGHGWKCELFE